MAKTIAVVLAAGLGTRMKSQKPKVLHKIAGQPLITHVLSALRAAGTEEIIAVLGYKGEAVEKVLGAGCQAVYQKEQLGTGHALLQALPQLNKFSEGLCLVACGDTPLLTAATLRALMERHQEQKAAATVLTALMEDPSGYGRIVQDDTGIAKIVEEKDAAPEEKLIREINTGTYCFNVKSLQKQLSRLTPANAQGEYYLTDIIKFLVEDGERVDTYLLENPAEAMGINNRMQLAEAEAVLRKRILSRHMSNGVTIIDPANTYVEATVEIGPDTILYPGVILEGKTRIAAGCEVGPFTRISDSEIGEEVTVQFSCLLESKVGRDCHLGPYCYLRPGTVLAERVKAGDFVEIKNSQVGAGSKIPHLSYVGDSYIGRDVNIGAGTITCNYDGEKKNTTTIGDKAFIGSNTNLVAPITVGAEAYIGAGSTVTHDIPAQALAVARGKQRNIENWKDRKRKGSGRDEKGER